MKKFTVVTLVSIFFGSLVSAEPRSNAPQVKCNERIPRSSVDRKLENQCRKARLQNSKSPQSSQKNQRSTASINVDNDLSWESYQNSPQVKKMVAIAKLETVPQRENEAKCCLHMVKQFMADGCLISEKPDIEYPVEFAKKYLDDENSGFTNILKDVKAKGSLKVAPVGAILIYEATDKKGVRNQGKPGHAEIKTGEGTYTSFYTSKPGRPRSGNESLNLDGEFSGNNRHLIGIYIKPDLISAHAGSANE